MYSVDGLKHGIERAKHNIRVLEEAIVKERNTITEYHRMIENLEEAARKKKQAEDSVHVEVERVQ